jgi:hypothetical protein
MSAKQRCVHHSKTCCQSLKHFNNVISIFCENVKVFESLTTSFWTMNTPLLRGHNDMLVWLRLVNHFYINLLTIGWSNILTHFIFISIGLMGDQGRECTKIIFQDFSTQNVKHLYNYGRAYMFALTLF